MPLSDVPSGTAARSGATLTVDLDAVVANWKILNARAGAAKTAAVVKADAYGLGMPPVARALARAGCGTFYVALPEEGHALRAALAKPDIYVFVGSFSDQENEIMAADRLMPVLNDRGQIERFAAFARKRGERLPCAIHLDTGMNRLGLSAAETSALIADPSPLSGLDVRVVMSHLACANEPDAPLNERQRAAFALNAGKLAPGAKLSLANSGGIFLGDNYLFDQVRPGAAIYGLAPLIGRPNPMQTVVRLTAPIVQVRHIDSPGTVGYGATHRIGAKAKIVTVSVGYADGYAFSLGNRGHAFLGSIRLPVVGRVSMDLITLDASEVPEPLLRPGAEVELIGPNLTPDDIARTNGTIGYEVLTRLGGRLHRRYNGGESLMTAQDTKPAQDESLDEVIVRNVRETLLDLLAATGRVFLNFLAAIGRIVNFTALALFYSLRPPFYPRLIMRQMIDIGYYSLPVVGLTAIFTGMVLALQSYTGFARFQAESAIATVVVLSMTRELGPVLAALMVAGRMGASMAAEIGTMRVTEQIDALTTLSTNPYKYLVMPRLIAGFLMLPCLVAIADIIGVFGGFLISVNKLGFNAAGYLHQTFSFLEAKDVLSGLTKAAVFGFVISLMGCYHGYHSKGGAQGVGTATTNAVVSASAMILIFNYLLTEVFFSR